MPATMQALHVRDRPEIACRRTDTLNDDVGTFILLLSCIAKPAPRKKAMVGVMF